jgi:hypothetical protein
MFERLTLPLWKLGGELGVRWSNVVRATLRKPGPKSPSRIAETLADGLDADLLFCDLHPHSERAAGLERFS